MPRKKKTPEIEVVRLPVLPLKDAVVFPHMVVPLLVGRPGSLAAVDESIATDLPLLLVTQKDPGVEEPGEEDLHSTGVAAGILHTLRMPDGTTKVVVEGLGRGHVRRFTFGEEMIEAVVERIDTQAVDEEEIQGLARTVLAQFEEYVKVSQRVAPEIVSMLEGIEDMETFCDTVSGYLPVPVQERQEVLATLDLRERLERVVTLLMRENELMGIEQSVRERVREQMERGQREHYLHEQLKVIHQELGNREEGLDEFTEMREMLEKAKMPKEVHEKAMREFARYERMPMMSPEGSVIRNYLEWLCDMPWRKRTKDAIDLKTARTVLDEDHYGLDKVKERILEFLAVRKLRRDAKGPILCLVGPPGVGKTSLGQSVARAMKRKFIRVSLGGVRDEAEIRGHRRTYIGALPGRIIQSMKKVGVRNPLFMLDEIDKMNADFRGDPSSALLEVLDPAQNKDFSDHFLEVEYDLSEVFFIATANHESNIPHALHDRMEVVRLSGYTLSEKAQIARLFLLPRQTEACGLKDGDVVLTDEGLDHVIQCYTREAGVRELERQISNVCRKVAREHVENDSPLPVSVDAPMVAKLLGPPPYSGARSEAEARVGVAIGMAWTSVGGDVLNIETSILIGKGKLVLTGQLGDVMKESAEAAHTVLRANAKELGAPTDFYKNRDVHVHVPEGAVPKDGPSAGVAILVSMLSALTGRAPRQALSMTGEITLRGRVLAVGGIKEKVLAAHRAGIRTIILPKENEKDLPDIPQEVREEVAFKLVDSTQEALKAAFPARRKRAT